MISWMFYNFCPVLRIERKHLRRTKIKSLAPTQSLALALSQVLLVYVI
jgi:hypothetical protein